MQNSIKTGRTVLVTDAERGSSIAIIRSLGKAGYHVIAADKNPKSIGFRSRFVRDTAVYPAPESSPQEFIESLSAVLIRKKVDLIIPVTETVIQPIISRRQDFEEITRIALPPNERLAAVTDKLLTIQLAKQASIPVPETSIVFDAEQALQAARSLSWPVVLKPVTSARFCQGNRVEKFEVSYAVSPKDLEDSMKKFEGRSAILLQSYHAGFGYGIELLMHQGDPLAAFAHKRLREFPITGGPSSYRESVKIDPRLYEYSLKLLKELRWTGLAMVEFKINGTDAVLMEINGRVWGSLPLAVVSGVDFPLMLTKMFLEGRYSVKPLLNGDYKTGLRCRDFQKDLMWIACVLSQKNKYPFLKMPGRLRAFQALAGLFNPRRKSDLFCLDDPLPALAELPRIVSKFREKIDMPISLKP